MGNHSSGMAMGRAAEEALRTRTTEPARQLLETICGPYRNSDAEFEAEDPQKPGFEHPEYANYTDPHGPIGRLIAEAFSPPGRDYTIDWKSADLEEQEEACERWFNGPHAAFRKHFGFW